MVRFQGWPVTGLASNLSRPRLLLRASKSNRPDTAGAPLDLCENRTMNILGPDIHAALLSVRHFHEHVALLLQTADAGTSHTPGQCPAA